jgi:EAL domain-containing protein (putative c-di-GMP-specific phosphodiesterase class I)
MTVYAEVFDDNRVYWVNLSGACLSDTEFTSFLESTIRNSDIVPGRLNFEIAESSAVQNLTDVAKVMHRLKKLGCQFALDDFGTGFSSFNYLQSLPIDCLKIDGLVIRKILHSPIDRMYVKSIIHIAREMNITTIAEFVEQDDLIDEVPALGDRDSH